MSISDTIFLLQSAQSEPSPSVIVSALYKALSLASSDPSTRAELRDGGACRLVASILHFNLSSSSVIASSLKLISKLLLSDEGQQFSVAESIDIFSSVDGCKDIHSILRKHGDKKEILYWCLTVLCLVCINDSKRTRFGSIGTVDAVLENLSDHIDAPEISEAGLRALHRLITDHKQNKERARASGGFDIIIRIIRKQLDMKEVAELGFLILNCLSCG